jgi:glycosyltransferase involved in cell wall biosynthesis
MTLSIVIPVYNSEKTIQRAILSAQRLGDIEIICVDDGSHDNSIKRIESMFTPQLSLVLVRHQQNRGVGAARNTGITHSTRTWITFLDADDEIHADADPLSVLKAVNNSNPDLVICLHHTEGTYLPPFDYELPIGILTRESLVGLAGAYLDNPRGNSIVSHCWGKIYRADFLSSNSLTFREDLSVYEDTEFVARCLKVAQCGYFSRDTLYRYTLSRGLSRSFALAPLGFRFALEQFAEFAGSVSDMARANAIFLAKTLSLSAQFSLRGRIDLCLRLAVEVDYLKIDASAIHDPLLRMIIEKQWYRYERACAFLLALKR